MATREHHVLRERIDNLETVLRWFEEREESLLRALEAARQREQHLQNLIDAIHARTAPEATNGRRIEAVTIDELHHWLPIGLASPVEVRRAMGFPEDLLPTRGAPDARGASGKAPRR